MSLALWRDISVVWLFLLCFIGMLIPLAVAYGAVWGMHKVLGRTRTTMLSAQSISSKVRSKTVAYSEKAVAPVIGAQRSTSSILSTFRVLAGGKHR